MSLRQVILMRLTDALRRRGRIRGAGGRGEQVAARHLRRSGYRILGRNLRSKLGEVDILALAPDGHTVVVVEVKARQVEHLPGDDLLPEFHVNRAKQDKLVMLAADLARKHKLTDRPIRFDVVGVDLPLGRSGAKPVVRHHEGAFESRV